MTMPRASGADGLMDASSNLGAAFCAAAPEVKTRNEAKTGKAPSHVRIGPGDGNDHA
jgi:hypothetical protein